MSEQPPRHVPPFFCPYCGEEQIRPWDAPAQWRCELCRRVWQLRYVGTAVGTAVDTAAAPPTGGDR